MQPISNNFRCYLYLKIIDFWNESEQERSKMTLPNEVRIIIVEQMIKHVSPTKPIRYLKTTKNFVLSTKEVRETLKKWRETGSVMNNKKGNSGRPKTVRLQK